MAPRTLRPGITSLSQSKSHQQVCSSTANLKLTHCKLSLIVVASFPPTHPRNNSGRGCLAREFGVPICQETEGCTPKYVHPYSLGLCLFEVNPPLTLDVP